MSKGFGKIQRDIIFRIYARIEGLEEDEKELIKNGNGEVFLWTNDFYDLTDVYEGKQIPKYSKQVVCESIRRMEKRGWLKTRVTPVNKEYRKTNYFPNKRYPTRENLVYVYVRDWKIWNPKQNIYCDKSLVIHEKI